jgi:hypothetical protein
LAENSSSGDYNSIINDLQNNLFNNMRNIKVNLENSRENDATEKEPLKIKLITSLESQKAVINYYLSKDDYLENPDVSFENKELIVRYKSYEKRIKFSKDLTKYLVIREQKFKNITFYTLNFHRIKIIY